MGLCILLHRVLGCTVVNVVSKCNEKVEFYPDCYNKQLFFMHSPIPSISGSSIQPMIHYANHLPPTPSPRSGLWPDRWSDPKPQTPATLVNHS